MAVVVVHTFLELLPDLENLLLDQRHPSTPRMATLSERLWIASRQLFYFSKRQALSRGTHE
jgi:hypothetical protein